MIGMNDLYVATHRNAKFFSIFELKDSIRAMHIPRQM